MQSCRASASIPALSYTGLLCRHGAVTSWLPFSNKGLEKLLRARFDAILRRCALPRFACLRLLVLAHVVERVGWTCRAATQSTVLGKASRV